MFKKKKNYILITVLFITIGLLGPQIANAGSIVANTLASLGNAALSVCSRIMWVSGQIFDFTIEGSMNNTLLEKSGFIESGWKISRDLANLFFIFILIFIGIATILQLSSYGYKQLLLGVIIAALLVNFSMVITNLIIDASNVLANEFYKNLKPSDGESLSAVFVSNLRPQTLFKVEDTEFGKKGEDATATQILLASVFGVAMMLVTSFVLLAGGFLFIIRSVTLTLLIILSPLAFVAMVLPNTKRHAIQWWTTLMSQAFFAPAFLFLFYLVAKTISAADFSNFLGEAKSGYAGIIFDGNNVALIVQFITLIMLMLGTLTVAKMMGGAGAGQAIGAAKWTKNKVQGYAGWTAKRTLGTGAGKIVQSKAAQAVARTPVVGWATRPVAIGLSKAAQARQKDIDNKTKKYLNYAPTNLASIIPNLSSTYQKSIVDKLDGKKLGKMVGKMSETGQISMGRRMLQLEKKDKNKKFTTKFANATNDLDIGTKIIYGDNPTKEQSKEYTDKLNKKQLRDLKLEKIGDRDELFKGFMGSINKNAFSAMATSGQIKKLSEAINKFADRANITSDKDERYLKIAELLEDIGNRELSNYFVTAGKIITSDPGKHIVKRGATEEFKVPKAETPPAPPPPTT